MSPVGITHIDPAKYNLLFERFFNPEKNNGNKERPGITGRYTEQGLDKRNAIKE